MAATKKSNAAQSNAITDADIRRFANEINEAWNAEASARGGRLDKLASIGETFSGDKETAAKVAKELETKFKWPRPRTSEGLLVMGSYKDLPKARSVVKKYNETADTPKSVETECLRVLRLARRKKINLAAKTADAVEQYKAATAKPEPDFATKAQKLRASIVSLAKDKVDATAVLAAFDSAFGTSEPEKKQASNANAAKSIQDDATPTEEDSRAAVADLIEDALDGADGDPMQFMKNMAAFVKKPDAKNKKRRRAPAKK